jgi:hypothetical protein
MQQSPKLVRRNSAALKNVVVRRSSLNTVVNLNALVRVFFLDGSSKVLQMFENSTASDVLIALKFNLDLEDISTHALFRVLGNSSIRRVDLHELIADVLKDPTDSGQEVRLLFRSWITYKYGSFDNEVFQYGNRFKQPNTALWLSFMEASFMTMSERFYLTEDESLLLGCLKLQAESGDFNPSIHSLEVLKSRVSSRFPNPLKSKMKALMSSTVAGSGLANDLATRVQHEYARIAGKSKVDAQIDYLLTLRTFCPFYGSSFFDLHCQYDDNPLEQETAPPVISMIAAIGPLAITLMTTSSSSSSSNGASSPHHASSSSTIQMRHPYKRIIKWISYPDKHIFTYWILKPKVSLADIEDYQEEALAKAEKEGKHKEGISQEIDTKRFCDCVYLVTSQVKELEYLVKSCVEAVANHPPALPDAKGELLSPLHGTSHVNSSSNGISSSSSSSQQSTTAKNGSSSSSAENSSAVNKEKMKSRVSRIGLFFNALGIKGSNKKEGRKDRRKEEHNDEEPEGEEDSGDDKPIEDDDDEEEEEVEGGVTGGTGLNENSGNDDIYGDDTAGVSGSVFQSVYKNLGNNSPIKEGDDDSDASIEKIPPAIKYAASMSELKRLAEEQNFSDNDDEDQSEKDDDGSSSTGDGSDDDDEDDDEDSNHGEPVEKSKSSEVKRSENEEKNDKIPKISTSKAFKRASKILFG